MRRLHDERACAYWQADWQLRVQGWQFCHSCQSGAAARVGSAQHKRVCALCQADCQHRVRRLQLSHSLHPGGPPQEVLRTAYGDSPCGKPRPVRAFALGQIGCQRRVQAWQVPHSHHPGVAFRRSAPGKHTLCEHLLSGKLVASAACRADRLHIPIIRVSPSAGARRAITRCASICFLTN